MIATAQAAALLSLGERQVRNLARAGDLPASERQEDPGGSFTGMSSACETGARGRRHERRAR